MSDACTINNPSLEPFTLPYPLLGVIPSGRTIVFNRTVAQVLVLAPTIINGARLSELPVDYPGPFDAGYSVASSGSGLVNPPVADNLTDIGSTAFRFRRIYLGSGLIAPSIGPVLAQQHTVPAVASDTVALLAAAQAFSNKTLFGTDNNALNYDAIANNAPVEMFGAEVRGAAGAGAGAAGLAARVPFRAANSVGTVTRAGAIEGGWVSPTAGSERGYTAMCGVYAGAAYPAMRAVVPAAVAAYTNGVEVEGAVTGTNPVLRPFGFGADLGLDFQAIGLGVHRFYGQTKTRVTDDGGMGGLALQAASETLLTVNPAFVGAGALQLFSVTDSLGVESEIGAIAADVQSYALGAVQGGIAIRPADGMNGPLGAGLLVAPEGAASAKVNGAKIVPAATGGYVQYTAYGEANISVRVLPLGTGSISLMNAANTVARVTTNNSGVAFNGAVPAAPPVLGVGATTVDIATFLASIGLTTLV
jgi:hypothetical protein